MEKIIYHYYFNVYNDKNNRQLRVCEEKYITASEFRSCFKQPENKVIVFCKYEELSLMLDSNKKYQMILASYTIIGLVIIVYYLKQLLVSNHFFIIKNNANKEEDDSPIETEMTFFTPTIDNIKNNDKDN